MNTRADPSPVAAIFDVDGTLTRSDIVRDHVHFRSDVRTGLPHLAWMSTFPLRALTLLILDKLDRLALNRIVHGWYQGFTAAELSDWADEFQANAGLQRVFPRALALLADHAREGHRLIFLTGTLELLVRPLAAELSRRLPGQPEIRVEAVRLEDQQGVFTGTMLDEALGGEAKRRRLEEVASEENLDLARSHAYGDSIWDLPVLEAVGRPAVVNPDRRLSRVSLERGWPRLLFDPSRDSN